MHTANRPRGSLSTALLLAPLAFALGGCPDPQGSFNDFTKRVPDAAQPADVPSTLADISGEFLFSLLLPATNTPIQFIAKNTFDTTTRVLNCTLTPLNATTRVRLSGADLIAGSSEAPGAPTDIPVSMSGAFVLAKDDAKIPGAANSIIPGADAEIMPVEMDLSIQSTDFYCGTGKGMIIAPIPQDISGSTVGAIRITTGAEGSALPQPVTSCAVSVPDAGAVDAFVADAKTHD
jgi:hypothetical protein